MTGGKCRDACRCRLRVESTLATGQSTGSHLRPARFKTTTAGCSEGRTVWRPYNAGPAATPAFHLRTWHSGRGLAGSLSACLARESSLVPSGMTHEGRINRMVVSTHARRRHTTIVAKPWLPFSSHRFLPAQDILISKALKQRRHAVDLAAKGITSE